MAALPATAGLPRDLAGHPSKPFTVRPLSSSGRDVQTWAPPARLASSRALCDGRLIFVSIPKSASWGLLRVLGDRLHLGFGHWLASERVSSERGDGATRGSSERSQTKAAAMSSRSICN